MRAATKQKALRFGRALKFRFRKSRAALLLGSGTALELRGELLDAAGGVDEALLAGVGGVRVHRDVTRDNEIFLTIDLLLAGGLQGGLGEETPAGPDIEEADVVQAGMSFSFHRGKGLTLARLVTRLDFVDDVNLALAAHDLAGRVTLLGRFDGGNDFHKRSQSIPRPYLCQRNIARG